MKLLLVVSPGGHLLKLTRMKAWWQQFDRLWVTDMSIRHSMLEGESVVAGFFPENRNLFNGFRNTILAIKVVFGEKPDVIISTGAGIALPFFVVGKLFGVKLIFIETFMYIAKATLTGRLAYLLADEFVIQHKGLHAYYPKAHLVEMSL